MPEAVVGALGTVAGIVVLGVAAFGFGFGAMPPPSFFAARVCFWISGMWLAFSGSAWGLYGTTWRIEIASAAFVVALVGLVTCLRWVALRERAVADAASAELAPPIATSLSMPTRSSRRATCPTSILMSHVATRNDGRVQPFAVDSSATETRVEESGACGNLRPRREIHN